MAECHQHLRFIAQNLLQTRRDKEPFQTADSTCRTASACRWRTAKKKHMLKGLNLTNPVKFFIHSIYYEIQG